MAKKIKSHVVHMWGSYSARGKFVLSGLGDDNPTTFETPYNQCKQTAAYDVGRVIRRTLDKLLYNRRATPRYTPAFLFSQTGLPDPKGLRLRQHLPMNFRQIDNNNWYSAAEKARLLEAEYAHEVCFDGIVKTPPGRKEVLELFTVFFGTINKLFHGVDFIPPPRMVTLTRSKARECFTVSWLGSNVFLASRPLYHGLCGILRDIVDFAAQGYSLKDLGLDYDTAMEVLKGTSKVKIRNLEKKVLQGLARFRAGRGNTPFASQILRMFFMATQGLGYQLFLPDLTKHEGQKLLLDTNPDHNQRHHQEIHTLVSNNFLPNWTTGEYFVVGWWENNARFAAPFEKQFVQWRGKNKTKTLSFLKEQ